MEVDVRIFQEPRNYRRYLRPKDEVRAKNGYVWMARDQDIPYNTSCCSYLCVVPTHGNCLMCGRSGPLGNLCLNRCSFSTVSAESIGENAKKRSNEYREDPD